MRRVPVLAAVALLTVAFAPPLTLAQQKDKEKPKVETKSPQLPAGTQSFLDVAYGDKGERNTLDI